MKHTPTPWVRQGQGILNHPVTGAPITLERIETSLGLIEIHDMTNEPNGNFNLMLAAPDLLVSLQEMLAVFQDHEQYDEDSAEVIKMARAAINKATT